MLRRLALLGTALVSGALAAASIALIEGGGRASAPSAASGAAAIRVTSATVLALRVPDPRGGPPWGLQVVHNSRGWICLQVGRVAHGRFGELGVDGAFGNDGQLHPAPPRWFAEAIEPGAGDVNDECLEPGETFAGQIGALDRSAAFGVQERAAPAADLRQISFGLLGRHARAIGYEGSKGEVMIPVHPPYGAYLIVQPIKHPGFGTGVGAAPGSDDPAHLRPTGLTGALTSIVYRAGGRRCREVKNGPTCTLAPPA